MTRRHTLHLLAAALAAATLSAGAHAAPRPWLDTAPEALPPVTVRWEDAEQREVFVVEGIEYRCRVATQPARILSLNVRGKEVLGPGGARFGFTDAKGTRYEPAPRDVTPRWNVWRRQWVPASDSRARMNVWSAGPYYWDAHLLDIPLVSEAVLAGLKTAAAGPALAEWLFDRDTQGWEALNNCRAAWAQPGAMAVTLTGDDPYLQSPLLNIPGPVLVTLRLRARSGGGALYWMEGNDTGYNGTHVATFGVNADGEWHEYRVPLRAAGNLKRLRFDPPGTSGLVEVDSIRVEPLAKEDPNAPAPARGEVIFHAHPDQLRIELRVEPASGQPAPQNALLALDAKPSPFVLREVRPAAILRAEGASAGVLGPARSKMEGAEWSAPLDAAGRGAYWAIRPLAGSDLLEAFADDVQPARLDVSVTGGKWLGYDGPSGLYRMQADVNLSAFGFEAAFTNPTRRAATAVRIRGDRWPHRMVVKCMTGIGCLEGAVLADANGFPLPVPAFVAKNFAGEREEPDDSAFGDSYFPLTLAPNEERSFQVLHLMQSWGNHLLKQVSSIRFFNIYWHLSTGVSESTCFTHNWMQIGRSGILHIPDFRPRSGPFWAGQPQHDCQQWPGFLQYNGAKGRLVYERTTFDSVSPNLARFTLHYHTSDGAATARLDVMEIPQGDEMRTFVHLRYDWKKPVAIEGDARSEFRWLNLFEKHLPDALLWSDAAGATQTRAVAPGEKPMLLGEPLAKDSPFIASRPKGDRYGCVTLVRTFKARLGGRDFDQPAASALFGSTDGTYWLTVPAERLALQPGDFVEAEVMLMPQGEGDMTQVKAERERKERFGAGIPSVSDVTAGTKRGDFPAIVRADDEVAAFTLSGGCDTAPLIVEGFRGWGVPLLWKDGVWQDQQVHGGDGYQVDPDGQGGYRFTFDVPIRTGQKPRILVTRAECSTGISRVRDVNGLPALETIIPGEFRLKAPCLFGPGRNEVAAGAPAVSFTGANNIVQAVPVSVSLAKGRATVDVDAGGALVIVKGDAATLTFSQLARGESYVVTVNGQATQQTAANGTLTVRVPAGETKVTVIRG